MKFNFNDGGRAAAGYKGTTGDCVTRAIAIATGTPYQEVYDALNELGQNERTGKRKRGKSNARKGVFRVTYERYILAMGWTWTPTMKIGQGCKVHLTDGELPMGRLIVAVSRHLTTVIDGVIHDTFDPQREREDFYFYNVDGIEGNTVKRTTGGRCVYGYYQPPALGQNVDVLA